MLKGKKIILGICGSIAAYKAATLTRLLVKAGAEVQVVMTPEATAFITPLTLATLSNKPVLTEYFDEHTGEWNKHVHLGLWADRLLIAPASANTLAKLANGLCDNLLCAIYLSARCPVYFAPAMDLDMFSHPATQQNIQRLQSFGNILIPPDSGELASGLVGEGRLAEPEEITTFIEQSFATGGVSKAREDAALPLAGKKALVSAGPTYEAIDPVRFIGNHSSGKMGYAIAETLQGLGADVTLVSGPTALAAPQQVLRIDVTSAKEMLEACTQTFTEADITVMSAAVADYTPVEVASQKIKKKDPHFSIALTKTTDILASLGAAKRPDQILAGFALETNNEEANALIKLENKNLDFIVLNSMQDKGAGFAGDSNKITIIDRNKQQTTFALKSKKEVATDICNYILTIYNTKSAKSL
ncbi:bifunctional phosphopantothenoylcysteine decarboxylase/phosphopantothenate--cysteine ligase CoaBC [Olivibacter sp. SDN3]|uniref:bifunctional phosphopantothenoylcysteine decarboxylase/phosphopantothenate--cysteine ligase CoaBC n=1 Tax=Olivibacter sp. SDN3 TaxID=2764720 RepID=UPI0016517A92|nr:bifunctional phosphopantothenoylcysteine decarboxylase/phosphopantothenate--cysteine ligase CoaBC [Olivibacter sp. SDN3]QNL51565.1 bifunctional phosphopantothenoylcysteine decarboxylase/phosphopantothenate--cysteine ligase CoaBC [Olivibacter sp. SDN3]